MENQKTFHDTNLLILISLPEQHYFKFLCRNCAEYFATTQVFDFIAHSRQHGTRATERHIRELIRQNDVHLVLVLQFVTDFELSVEYYASLKELSKLAFWFFDDDMYFDATSKYYAQAADAVLTTDFFPSMAYKRLEIPAMYSTPVHNPEIFYPVQAVKDIDVCFVGDCTKCNRMEYINFLISNGIKVETYGYGSKNGFLPEEKQISTVYSRAKIILTFSKLDIPSWPVSDDPLLRRVRQNKGHFAQIALTRSFCLSEYAPSLHTMGRIGEEFAVFNDEDELLSKVRYYLAHEKERDEMAGRAYEMAKKTFIDTVAFPKLMSELHETLYNPRNANPYAGKLGLSSSFKTKYVTGLTFSFFILLGSAKLLNAGELFIRLFRYGPGPFLAGFPAGTIRALMVVFHKLTGGYSRIYKK